ncbi:PEFG-CTERM sorting domain-containing protein [Candidatus Nitrosotalea bavarica]|uniref:PEFG-CTERM sorting domain-containing protein n=1 Tax=Candidatus Nitrosotalea bavarica TaxID=1903277 RepID=UPI000C712F08|nr:PEFG-CTERM sorting domain-containing protein [Candidatus Nitrosotalea bavarica]
MQWGSYAIMTVIIFSIGVAPVFAQTPQQFAVKDARSGQSSVVNYSITGATLDTVSINHQDTSIIVFIKSASDGNLTISMPRSLIDAKVGTGDDQFFVLVDGADTDFTESKTNTDRTVTVSFPQDTQQIEIIGTQVVPEFGGLAFVVLVVAIISIVVISAKTRLKFSL